MTLPAVSESLAGRMEIVSLLPLSQGEIRRERPGFLKRILAGRPPDCLSPSTGDELVKIVLSGGYPEMLRRRDPGRRRAWVRDYVDALFLRDVPEISNLEHRDRLLPLFRLMALQSGQIPNFTQWGGQIGLDAKTTKKYVSVLERLFLIHRLPAWHSNRTSRLIKSPKLHLVDSGIQANLTGATKESLVKSMTLNPDRLAIPGVKDVQDSLEMLAKTLADSRSSPLRAVRLLDYWADPKHAKTGTGHTTGRATAGEAAGPGLPSPETSVRRLQEGSSSGLLPDLDVADCPMENLFDRGTDRSPSPLPSPQADGQRGIPGPSDPNTGAMPCALLSGLTSKG